MAGRMQNFVHLSSVERSTKSGGVNEKVFTSSERGQSKELFGVLFLSLCWTPSGLLQITP